MKQFPWRGFLYELRRGLLSIPLVVLTALILVAAFGILAQIATSQPAPSTFPEESGDYYFAGGEYHFEFYAYTQSGTPISGAVFTVNMYPPNETLGTPQTSLANVTGITSSLGLTQFAVPLNGLNYTAALTWCPPNAPAGFCVPGFETAVSRPPAGATDVYDSTWTATVQSTHHLLLINSLLIFYPGPNGTPPPNYQVYWAASQNEPFSPTPLAEGSMHRLGELSSPAEIFPLVVPTYTINASQPPFGPPGPQTNGYLQIELFTAAGQLVAMDTNQSAGNFFPPATGSGTAEALGFGGIYMVYLVPLMAVLAAYSVYGRDRLTGVLEGVLARPVSRLGLATSRYLAVVGALCIAVLLAMVCLEGLVFWVYGAFLTLAAALTLLAALLVEIGAFTGITFLLSHRLKSAGGLLGISLGVVALFTVGWVVLPVLIAALTGTLFTPGYQTTMVQLQFLNPVQFFGLSYDQLYQTVPNIVTFGEQAMPHPSAYGITLGSLIVTGLAWTVLPLAAFLYVVRHWD
jgi:ABC-type transport system involved in multi-copper enzyme maturation permease subunit